MTHSDETGVTMTGSDIALYRVLTVRRALILKIDTGMALTRKSPITVAQHDGLSVRRTNRAVLQDVNRWLSRHGVEPKWSKTYPNG